MLITDIEIRDFKTIRHLRWSNIPDHGVFVIHGDNEQGKSTVLEAIAQVLHTKHSSRAQAVKDTQPLGSDVGPQVTVNLTLGGKNVRLFKQWLKTPRAELTISGDGSYTGGDAEQRFEEFFHKHVDQTLFTALYNRQGSMVHPLVLGGITSLTQVLAEASGVSGVGDGGHAQTRDAETGPLLARIIGEYHKYYTQRGKPTKQFQAHHDRVAAATQAAQDAASRLEELHHHVAEVERITTARVAAERELPGQREIRDTCHEDYEAARQIQHQAEQLDRDQELARVRLQAAEAALAKRLELMESERAGRERVDKLEAALVDLQQAADAEVNDDLETLGLASPPGVVSPRALGLPEGRLAEEYLSLIEVLDEAHLAGGSHVADLIDCGQAADGIADGGLDTGGADDGTHPMSDVARNLLELRIAHDIEQQVANRTAVPGGWRRWAQQQLHPTIDWRATLRATIRQGLRVGTGQVDYSYRRPSRRPAPDGVILPTMVAPKPEIAVVVDTSGSVSGQQLNTIMTELIGIIQHANLRQIRVICCDVVAHPPQTIRAGHMPLFTGGGGTDIRAGITAASKLKPQPTLIIVLTDGETPWPDRRPPIPVIIGVIQTPRRDPTSTYPVPWWAHTVNIDQ